jgi:hypothetical protein
VKTLDFLEYRTRLKRNGLLKVSRKSSKSYKFLAILFWVFCAAYAVNALVIFAFSSDSGDIPLSAQQESIHSHVEEVSGVESSIEISSTDVNPSLEWLSSLYLNAVSKDKVISISGYVNLALEDPIIRMNSENSETPFFDSAYIISHEQGHILQKRVVAESGLGYPSYLNPIQTGVYFFNFYRLNKTLESISKQESVQEKTPTLTKGIEVNADCISEVTLESKDIRPFFYYQDKNGCSITQLMTAYALLNSEWPSKENIDKYYTKASKIFYAKAFDDSSWLYREYENFAENTPTR